MFLLVLNEIQYGSMKDCSNVTGWITSTLFKRYWGIDLSGQSRELLMAGLSEMHAACLIRQDEPQLSAEFVVLTGAGKEVVELQLDPDPRGKRYY
jgi:hypothetical protein